MMTQVGGSLYLLPTFRLLRDVWSMLQIFPGILLSASGISRLCPLSGSYASKTSGMGAAVLVEEGFC